MDEEELIGRFAVRAAAGHRPSLGIVGGTFDPIHLGHTALGEAARTELGLDGVLYLPAGVPSFKQDRRIASGESRAAMVRLAIRDLPDSALSMREIAREGVTYTVDTLLEMHDRWPEETRLIFVRGEDSFETFSHWHRSAEILELCELAVASRPGSGARGTSPEVLTLPVQSRVRWLASRVPTVSSTEVRRALADGAATDGLLDPRVAGYIRSHGLYGTASAVRTEGGDAHGKRQA